MYEKANCNLQFVKSSRRSQNYKKCMTSGELTSRDLMNEVLRGSIGLYDKNGTQDQLGFGTEPWKVFVYRLAPSRCRKTGKRT